MFTAGYRYFLVLFCTMCLCQALQAQGNGKVERKGKFSGLLRLGVCTSQIYNDDFGGYNKIGPTGGFGVYTPVSDKLTFQMELNYCNRGSRRPARPDKGDYFSYRISSHYIDIPLLLKTYIWKFEFEAGICNGIYLFHSEKDNYGRVPVKSFDSNRYELAGNVAVNVPVKGQWYVNVRFHHSILPAMKNLVFIPGYGLAGGAYNNAILFTLNRRFEVSDR